MLSMSFVHPPPILEGFAITLSGVNLERFARMMEEGARVEVQEGQEGSSNEIYLYGGKSPSVSYWVDSESFWYGRQYQRRSREVKILWPIFIIRPWRMVLSVEWIEMLVNAGVGIDHIRAVYAPRY